MLFGKGTSLTSSHVKSWSNGSLKHIVSNRLPTIPLITLKSSNRLMARIIECILVSKTIVHSKNLLFELIDGR